MNILKRTVVTLLFLASLILCFSCKHVSPSGLEAQFPGYTKLFKFVNLDYQKNKVPLVGILCDVQTDGSSSFSSSDLLLGTLISDSLIITSTQYSCSEARIVRLQNEADSDSISFVEVATIDQVYVSRPFDYASEIEIYKVKENLAKLLGIVPAKVAAPTQKLSKVEGFEILYTDLVYKVPKSATFTTKTGSKYYSKDITRNGAVYSFNSLGTQIIARQSPGVKFEYTGEQRGYVRDIIKEEDGSSVFVPVKGSLFLLGQDQLIEDPSSFRSYVLLDVAGKVGSVYKFIQDLLQSNSITGVVFY